MGFQRTCPYPPVFPMEGKTAKKKKKKQGLRSSQRVSTVETKGRHFCTTSAAVAMAAQQIQVGGGAASLAQLVQVQSAQQNQCTAEPSVLI